ncbi:MAG: hypothetical protein WC538_21185 [Thermoanaerobaculia bacterium]|jgi:RHS repeat-associated protein
MNVLVLWLVGSTVAYGQAWQEWSDTDISRFWNLPEGQAARSHVDATPLGGASYSIRVDLPPSRYTPDLTIRYSPSSDDFQLGLGWTLGIPAIVENPTPDLPDFEALVGPDGPLVPLYSGLYLAHYRPLEDQSESRKIYTPTAGNRMTVTGKTGEIWTYARRAIPGGPLIQDRYVLLRKQDANGNRIDYEYTEDGRIEQVSYGGNANGDPAEITVDFLYEPRACVRTDMRFAQQILHDQRLATIQVKVGSEHVRRLRLDYEDCPDRLQSVEDTAFNGQVANTRAYTMAYGLPGWDEDTAHWSLPQKFWERETDGGSTMIGGVSSGFSTLAVANVNGDPLPDGIDVDGVNYAHLAHAGIEVVEHELAPSNRLHPAGAIPLSAEQGAWSNPVGFGTQALGAALEDVAIADIDGDGFDDVARATNDSIVVRWGSPEGIGDTSSTLPRPYDGPRALVGTYRELHGDDTETAVEFSGLYDWDGDGRLDLVRGAGSDRFHVYRFSRTLRAWEATPRTVHAPWCNGDRDFLIYDGDTVCPLRAAITHGHGTQQRSATQDAGVTEMNGDGLPDFVVVEDLGWHVYLGQPDNSATDFVDAGYWSVHSGPFSYAPGAMLRHIELRPNPNESASYTTSMLLDYDGDGLSDLVDLEASTVYLNGGDAVAGFRIETLDADRPLAFAASYTATESAFGSFVSSTDGLVDTRDWNGDGRPDVAIANSIDATAIWLSRPAGLLVGVQTAVTYTALSYSPSGESKPSGTFFDLPGVTQQHLGFAVVHTVTELDSVTGNEWSVQYDFGLGEWDPVRRRFLGFGEEVVTDSLYRRSQWLRRLDYPYTGLVSEVRYGAPGAPRIVRTTTYDELLPRDGKASVVGKVGEVSEEREFADDSMTGFRSRSASFSYDANANLTLVQLHGSSPNLPPFDEVEFSLTWGTAGVNGLAAACVADVRAGRPFQGELPLLQRRRIYYDGHIACDAGHGNATRVEAERKGVGIPSETRAWAITRNAFGQVATTTSPGGAATERLYDPTSVYVAYETDPVGLVTSHVKDVWGNTTSSTAPSGAKVITSFDGWRRPLERYRESPSVPRFPVLAVSYMDGANPSATTTTYQDDGSVDSTTVQFFDGWYNLIQTRRLMPGSQWLVSDVDYYPDGQVRRTGAPYTSATPIVGFGADLYTERYYDEIGKWDHTIDAIGGVSRDVTTDPWETVVADSENFTTHHEFDGLGHERFTWAQNDLGELAPSEFEWDGLGRIRNALDPDGVITSFDWSSIGELLSVTSDDFGEHRFEYDVDGHLTDSFDSANRHVHYELDEAGRVLLVQHEQDGSGLTTVETYTWDSLVPGALTSVTDAAGSVAFTYDGLGRLASEKRTFPDGSTATHRQSLDHQDRIAKESAPDGVVINNSFGFGRLSSKRVRLADSRDITFMPEYDGRGRFVGFPKDGWKLSLKLTLDDLDRVGRMRWRLGPNGSDVETTHDYGFLGNGLIKSRALLGSTEASRYRYDAAGRLRVATQRGAAQWSLTDGGVPLSRTGLDSRNYVEVPASHQIHSVTVDNHRYDYFWDASGSATRIEAWKDSSLKETIVLGYDAAGRPTFATNGRKTGMSRSYGYDGSIAVEVVEGKMIKRLGVWENVNGQDRTMLSIGGFQVGRIENGRTLVATSADVHGTPTKVMKEDLAVNSTLELDPYGSVMSKTGNADIAHHWLGLPRDGKLALISMGARLFDERSRTFLSPDPLATTRAGVNMARDPYGGNPYAYARWNALSLRDASGKAPEPVSPTGWDPAWSLPALSQPVVAQSSGFTVFQGAASAEALAFRSGIESKSGVGEHWAMPANLGEAANWAGESAMASQLEHGGYYFVTAQGTEGFVAAPPGQAHEIDLRRLLANLSTDGAAIVQVHGHWRTDHDWANMPSAGDFDSFIRSGGVDAILVAWRDQGSVVLSGRAGVKPTFLDINSRLTQDAGYAVYNPYEGMTGLANTANKLSFDAYSCTSGGDCGLAGRP